MADGSRSFSCSPYLRACSELAGSGPGTIFFYEALCDSDLQQDCMNINLSRFAYRRQENSLQTVIKENCDAEQRSVPNRATSLAPCSLFSGFVASKRQKRSLKGDEEETKENVIYDEESPACEAKNKRRTCRRFIASDSDEEGVAAANSQARTGSGMPVKRVRFSLSSFDDPIPEAVVQKAVMESSSDSEDVLLPANWRDVRIPMSANPPNSSTKTGAKVEVASSVRAKLSRFTFWPRDRTQHTLPVMVDKEVKQQDMEANAVEECRVDHQGKEKGVEDESASEDERFSDQEQEQKFEEEEEEEEREEDEEDEEEEEEEEEGYTSRKQNAVLDFINTCTEEEACSLPGNSLKKANLLLSLRPFKNWKDLMQKLSATKGLSDQVVSACVSFLDERKVIDVVMKRCQKISGDIQSLLRTSQESQLVTSPPSLLSSSCILKPYQVLGFSWLTLLHSMNVNGILADEMGLGKTVQAITFLAYLHEQGKGGPYLIVVPASTLNNWARELMNWCPALRVVKYWGPLAERLALRDDILNEEGEQYDVILTTYNICVMNPEDRKLFRKLSLQCLVLDEGHMLKNMASQRYYHLMRMKATRRILLTGTPLQNNLVELISLLSFVMPDVFSRYSDQVRKAFSRARKDECSKYYQQQIAQAREIMKPFVLRRLKMEVLDQLPTKLEMTEICVLTTTQQELYSKVKEQARKQLTGLEATEQYRKSLDVMMQLRKIANHPLLIRHVYEDDKLRQMSRDILKDPKHCESDPQLVWEDMSVMSDFELHTLCSSVECLREYCLPSERIQDSGKLICLTRLLRQAKEEGSRVLLFSQFTQMLDIIEVFLQQVGHRYLRFDGKTPVAERQALIDQYNQNNEIHVFLLSTKAGGLGINLTSANVVVIHDIDFNPYNDKQAMDRCHRVGQTKDVKVTRLIGKGTVEEDMFDCALSKLKLEKDINQAGVSDDNDFDVRDVLKKGLGLEETVILQEN